jgi:N-acetylglucosaminyl-diphospho-decaprenol L-rhamnosyltransferase
MSLVSILILNWNGTKYIFDCLESVREKVRLPYEVIVVDNHSSDGSPDRIAEDYPWVKLVRSDDNLGFAKGNNLAALYASGKYLLLLNYDTLLLSDITDAVRVLEADPSIGVVGAQMFALDGTKRPSCAYFPRPSRLLRLGGLWFHPETYKAGGAGVEIALCDSVEGSFLMTPAAIWKQFGGMDERNYMYCDDVEYCRSVFDAGYRTAQCKSVSYVHYGQYTHARMAYLFGGYRRYHAKFSARSTQLQADFVLYTGLVLRLPWYITRYLVKRDTNSREAMVYAWRLFRNWSETSVDAMRHHG